MPRFLYAILTTSLVVGTFGPTAVLGAMLHDYTESAIAHACVAHFGPDEQDKERISRECEVNRGKLIYNSRRVWISDVVPGFMFAFAVTSLQEAKDALRRVYLTYVAIALGLAAQALVVVPLCFRCSRERGLSD